MQHNGDYALMPDKQSKSPVSEETGLIENGGMDGTRTRGLLRDRQTL